MTRHFTAELATEFERSLHSVNAAITRTWLPGLTDSEIDALSRPHDLDLPEEARVWWRWHNGAAPDTRGPLWDLLPNRALLDLATVLEGYAHDRGAVLQLEGATGRLRPLTDSPWIFFGCNVGRDDPVPIYVGDFGEHSRLVLPSIGELVAVWIALIDSGVFETDDDGVWRFDDERLPAEVQKLGVY